MTENILEIENELGEKINLYVLATINNNNQLYIIYTDNTFDEENLPNLFVSEIIKEENGFRLEEIDNYEEIEAISKEMDKILSNYQ